MVRDWEGVSSYVTAVRGIEDGFEVLQDSRCHGQDDPQGIGFPLLFSYIRTAPADGPRPLLQATGCRLAANRQQLAFATGCRCANTPSVPSASHGGLLLQTNLALFLLVAVKDGPGHRGAQAIKAARIGVLPFRGRAMAVQRRFPAIGRRRELDMAMAEADRYLDPHGW